MAIHKLCKLLKVYKKANQKCPLHLSLQKESIYFVMLIAFGSQTGRLKTKVKRLNYPD